MGASYDPYTPKCTPHPVLQAHGYTSTPLKQFMNGLLFYEQVTVFRWHCDPFLIVDNKQISFPTPRDEQKAAIWRVCSPDLNLSATCERRWWGEQQAEMGYVSHMHISEDQGWCNRQCLLKMIHFKGKEGKGEGVVPRKKVFPIDIFWWQNTKWAKKYGHWAGSREHSW